MKDQHYSSHPHRGYLLRHRLMAIMARAAIGRATVLHAPAGYGKSVLASQFAAMQEQPVIWCQFDRTIDSPHAFATRLLSSIRQANGIGEISVVAPDLQLDGALRELSRSWSGYCVLVLDDLHHALESPDVQELVSRTLLSLPDALHLVLATRSWPLIPGLQHLIANGDLTVIDGRELAFTEAEIAEFATGVPSREIHDIFQATQGWPIGVSLAVAGLVRAHPPDLRNRFFTYLTDAVFQELSAEETSFMMTTSVLPWLTSELCDRLTHHAGASKLLDALSAKALVQTRFDGSLEYHPLIREFLLARSRASDSSLYRRIHLDAASLFAERRDYGTAVRLLSEVDAQHELCCLLETIAPDQFKRGRWQSLWDWIGHLSDEEIGGHSKLLLLKARLAFLRGDALNALDIASRVPHAEEIAEARVTRSAALALLGKDAIAAKEATTGIRLAREAADPGTEALGQLNLGIANARLGRYEKAEGELRKASRYFLQHGDLYGQALSQMNLAGIYHLQRRVDDETAALKVAELFWRKLGNHEHLARTLNNVGLSQHRLGDYEGSAAAYVESIELARQFEIPSTEAYASVGLADLLLEQGQFDKANALYGAGARQSKALGEMPLNALASAGLANVRRLGGELDEASAIAREALAIALEYGDSHERGVAWLARGLVALDAGSLDEAADLLGSGLAQLEPLGISPDLAKARLHWAVCRFRAGHRGEALDALRTLATEISGLPSRRFLQGLAERYKDLVSYAAAKGVFPVPRPVEEQNLVADQTLSLRALGAFDFQLNDEVIHPLAWETTKAKEFLGLLVIFRRPLDKDEIIELLWPELEATKSNSYFHATLHRVRRAVSKGIVHRSGRMYSVSPAIELCCDAAQFEEELRPFITGGDLQSGYRARQIYRGPLLPSVYSDWAVQRRTSLEGRYVWLLQELIRSTADLCDERLPMICEDLLAIDPCNETAWRELIAYWTRRGATGMARTTFRRCRRLYREQLGSEVPNGILAFTQSAP